MNNQEVIQLLQRELKDQGRTLSTNNIEFFCPNCKHYKRKLQVSTLNFKWHCWVCNIKGKSANSLLRFIGSTERVRQFENQIPIDKIQPKVDKLKLPADFVSFKDDYSSLAAKRALHYLIYERNLFIEDILRYNIGFCSSGQYSNCVIVPSYDHSFNLNYFTIRSINSSFKSNADVSRDIIPFESTINWNIPVVLTEAPFNAITIRHNAIPLYGTQLLSQLKQKLQVNPVKEVYIALDFEAKREAIKLCEELLHLDKIPYLIELNESDPNELGYSAFKQLKQKSIPYTNSLDLLKQQFRLL